MARAVNVILEVNNKEYDINQMGLVSMTFDRYLGTPEAITTGVLSNLDLTLFDITGYNLLSILQKEAGKVKIKYGFESNLSQKYVLNSLKYNATYNNLGVMVSIGAYGLQSNRKSKNERFLPGSSVKNMLEMFAERNGWYIGPKGSKEYIDVGDLRTSVLLENLEGESDIEFIMYKLLKNANRILAVSKTSNIVDLWDAKLTFRENRLEFYFKKRSARDSLRRIWSYQYGESTDNNIISFTNSVDLSFLVKGLTLKIPISATDFLVSEDQLENLREDTMEIIESKLNYIEDVIRKYGLPSVNPNSFLWNIEFVESEDVDTKDLESLILEKIDQTMNALNTIELQVIGNPYVMPTDLISLTIKNRDGTLNLLSSNSAVGGYWRIVKIREEVGVSGYTTTLSLVRENSVILSPENNSIFNNRSQQNGNVE